MQMTDLFNAFELILKMQSLIRHLVQHELEYSVLAPGLPPHCYVRLIFFFLAKEIDLGPTYINVF